MLTCHALLHMVDAHGLWPGPFCNQELGDSIKAIQHAFCSHRHLHASVCLWHEAERSGVLLWVRDTLVMVQSHCYHPPATSFMVGDGVAISRTSHCIVCEPTFA